MVNNLNWKYDAENANDNDDDDDDTGNIDWYGIFQNSRETGKKHWNIKTDGKVAEKINHLAIINFHKYHKHCAKMKWNGALSHVTNLLFNNQDEIENDMAKVLPVGRGWKNENIS